MNHKDPIGKIRDLERRLDETKRALRDATAAERKRCADLIAGMASRYPTSIFPENGTTIDAASARMGRHCAKTWAEELRRL